MPKQQEIENLVRKYEDIKNSGKLKSYSEEQTKKDFILPLFEILGWNVYSRSEVSAEETISSERVDYGFYLNDRIKFYLEAKKFNVNIHDEKFANQAIKYSFNKGATWAVLTNFETLIVFNAQDIEGKLSDKRFFEINYSEFPDRFDQLSLLSKEAFKNDLLDKEAEKVGKKVQKILVSNLLYKDLQNCRDILTKDLGQWNSGIDTDLLDEGVQKLLDRLLFIRVAEDRGIEPQTLVPMIRQARDTTGKHLYQSMTEKFREFDSFYNSNLFSEHPFEQWEEYSGATEKVISILYGKEGYYEYDFKAMPADVLGTVYENYLSHRLSKSRKGTTVSKDAGKRKKQGIYYTPSYIVDYIVKNAIGPILDKCKNIEDLKKIRVLDPACGSGSFLIKAFEVIFEKYKEFGFRGPENLLKIQILQENIYGVDLDQQAVEITRLNLLINALTKREKLPFLDNIKNGNSLVSGTDEELQKYFGKDFRDSKPFGWQEQFLEVFKQGGFDVIIGNPPYVGSLELSNTLSEKEKGFFKDKFKSAVGNFDLYVLFLEKSLSLLKDGGNLSFIVPNKFLVNNYGIEIRNMLLAQSVLKLVNFSNLPIFKSVGVYPVVMVLQKQQPKSEHRVEVGSVSEDYKIKYNDYPQNNWLSNKDKIITFSEEEGNEDIINKINKKSINIGNIATVNSGTTGFDYSNYGKLISESKSKGFIKFIITRNVEPYFINWGKNINYLKRKFSTPYFDVENKIVTEGRKKLYKDKNKIVIRGMSKKVVAGLDNEGCALGVGAYAIINSKIDNNLLLAFLNSKLITFYYISKFQNKHLAGGYLAFNAGQIKEIPIFDFNKKDRNDVSKLLTNLAKKLHVSYKLLFEATENSEKWNSIKSEIEKTDKEVDQKVYELYGLTGDEIKTIEDNIWE